MDKRQLQFLNSLDLAHKRIAFIGFSGCDLASPPRPPPPSLAPRFTMASLLLLIPPRPNLMGRSTPARRAGPIPPIQCKATQSNAKKRQTVPNGTRNRQALPEHPE
eukprot:125746-Pyramimonas_sp.AAC.1